MMPRLNKLSMDNKKGKEAHTENKALKWYEKNKSLVLRQTPFWAQSIVGVLISVGVLSVSAGLIFRVDEVITVTGQLEAISGSTGITAPVGGKIDKVFFKDGQLVKKGDLLLSIEAMKMETGIHADYNGVVKSIYTELGNQISAKDLLIEMSIE